MRGKRHWLTDKRRRPRCGYRCLRNTNGSREPSRLRAVGGSIDKRYGAGSWAGSSSSRRESDVNVAMGVRLHSLLAVVGGDGELALEVYACDGNRKWAIVEKGDSL